MFDLSSDLPILIVDHFLAIIIIVIASVIITQLTLGTIRRILGAMQSRAEAEASFDEAAEIAKRFATLRALSGYVVKGFVIAVGGLLVLEQAGLNVGPAIAGLGVVGIALAFGSQAIVRDFFSGILILVENQYSVGDAVDIAGASGVVEEITLRRTVLRDTDGVVHSVPNGEVKVASNRTRIWRRINYDVLIAYGTDIERATAIFNAVGADMAVDPAWADQILEQPKVDRVEHLGERGITLKILGRVRAASMVAVTGELRRRVLAAMTANALDQPPATSTPDATTAGAMKAFGPFAPSGPIVEDASPESDASADEGPPEQDNPTA
jgi:moderate conductance mechanosensitive channel